MTDGERSDGGDGVHDSLYRAVVATAVDALIVIDGRGRVLSLNAAAERLFGYAAHEIVGENVTILMPEPYHGEHDKYLDRYQRTAEKRIIGIGREVTGRRKDGSTFPMDLSVGEAQQDGARIYVGIIRDITQRKADELALRQGELRWRSVLDTVPDGLIVIDERGLIQSFSTAAERLFGYQEAEIVGRNVSVLMASPDREAHDLYLDRYRRTGERRIIGVGRVVVGLRKSGETFFLDLAVGEFSLGGKRFFTGFLRDLTERMQTERRLQDLQAELTYIARVTTLGEVTASIAHEMGQPLAAVTNNGAACLRFLDRDPPDLEEVRDGLTRIIGESKRAALVVQRIRSLAKREPSKSAKLDLNVVIDESVSLLQHEVARNRVVLRRELAARLPAVLGDKIQLQQVIINLIINGIQAMAMIDDRPRELVIRSDGHDVGSVMVSVQDSGVGIHPEHADRLFEPFFTTRPNGLGIGLSICRTIVEAHGGRIWTSSNAGPGATFLLSLPSTPDHAP